MAKIRYDRFYYEPLPESLTIGDSDIDGLGLFATESIGEDKDLGATHIKVPMISGFIRTPLGGFINHSEEPNCIKYYEDGCYFIRTIQTIKAEEELFLKYTFYKISK